MKLSGPRRGALLALLLLLLSLPALPLSAAEYRIEILEVEWELKPGLSTRAWTYGGRVPGTPIRARPGERLRIEVLNRLPEATNIHWHGLSLPNDQDGPSLRIEPGASQVYDFLVKESGSFWYHPHLMPVLPQLDRGLYAPLLVLAPEDGAYAGDHTLVLDDWYLDPRGGRIEEIGPEEMERYGNVETVNGKTEEAIEPLLIRPGELHKLRFINASTAAVHTLRAEGHRFRLTHADGRALGRPYEAAEISLAPGERLDVELLGSGRPGENYLIRSSRPELGLRIPILYRGEPLPPQASPLSPPPPRALLPAPPARPDFTLSLGSAMGGAGGMGMMHGGMMHGGPSPAAGGGGLVWTIDGRAYPDTRPIEVRAGSLVTMRIHNRDMMSMMMGHPMDHPIHLHGGAFQVLSINGRMPEGELWKDTIPVPLGGYVDLAFILAEPGDWALHCHIIDHEDGGMMTMVRAK